MGKEIERKFKVCGTGYKTGCISSSVYKQGYLSTDKERTVRVRIAGERAFLTVKGKNCGTVRSEFEYEIPVSDAETMLGDLCLHPLIEKMRHIFISDDGHKWEIDEFGGENEGLIVAEVELGSQDEPVEIPEWCGEEVSGDIRYYNSNLIEHPYSVWKNTGEENGRHA